MRKLPRDWTSPISLLAASALLGVLIIAGSSPIWSQQANNNNGNNGQNTVVVAGGTQSLLQRQVGGISIRPDGLIAGATTESLGKLSQARADAIKGAPGELQEAVPLRKVSLRRLNEAIAASLRDGEPLAEENLFLGGLQQIRYVFAYPEQNDIVLAGPAEGWRVDPRGNFVGATTGRPVMLLDDLLVALRTAASSRRTGITCSIDPTPEGRQRLQAHMASVHVMGNPKATADGIERALGRQQISFTGVPATSHFAGILLAADYRMKRLAMNFEPSPLKELPSFLHMIGASGQPMNNLMPRWWLEPTYQKVLRDASGMAWELVGSGVKCQTEEGFLAAGGQREATGAVNPVAQQWADRMTEHYAQLALAEPIFGELRNCMELAVVAAILTQHQLAEQTSCNLDALTGSGGMPTVDFPTATGVDSRVSMLKKGKTWIISASGGVSIYPETIVQKAQASDQPANARANAKPADKAFWN